MTIGQMGMKHPSLGAMVTAIQAGMSRVGLHYRFTDAATAFLAKCLRFVLLQKFSNVGRIDTQLLRPFGRVLIADSSSWDVSPKLRGVLPGSGGAASTASCKLQVVYDYTRGELQFLDVTPGTLPDNRYSNRLPAMLHKHDLLLVDQGYFTCNLLAQIHAKGAFFLTRLLPSAAVSEPLTKNHINLAQHLRSVQHSTSEIQVLIGRTVPCRLIILRVSEDVANQRRRRLKRKSQRKGRTVSKHLLSMCDWTLLITNTPRSWLPLEMVRALYTLRWQIELLFKQLKSVLRVHQSHTTKEDRLRCELYGKLIVAVLVHRIHAAETNTLWCKSRRELSMEKLYKRMQERAFSLLTVLLSSVRQALIYLRSQLKLIIPACLKGRQRTRMTTLEMIQAQYDPILKTKQYCPVGVAA